MHIFAHILRRIVVFFIEILIIIKTLLFSPFNPEAIHLLFLTYFKKINILCQSLWVGSERRLCVSDSSQNVTADYQPEMPPHNYRTQ